MENFSPQPVSLRGAGRGSRGGGEYSPPPRPSLRVGEEFSPIPLPAGGLYQRILTPSGLVLAGNKNSPPYLYPYNRLFIAAVFAAISYHYRQFLI